MDRLWLLGECVLTPAPPLAFAGEGKGEGGRGKGVVSWARVVRRGREAQRGDTRGGEEEKEEEGGRRVAELGVGGRA